MMRDLIITPAITDKQNKSIEKYFNDISKEKMISPQDEVLLAQKIKQGDRAALNRLVRANLRFVVSVAKKYQHMGMSLEDLINEGNLGLIKAAQRFDETLGFKFISFAVWWIRQSIMHALAEYKRTVRLPTNHINLLTKIGHNVTQLESRLERAPTSTELAELLQVELYKVEDAIFYSGRTVSYDAPVSPGDDYALINVLVSNEAAADDLIDELSAQDELEELFSVLSGIEREVIEYRFGFKGGREHSNREISELMGLYPEMIRLTLKRAMAKLKQHNLHEPTLV
ncbi:RNA polymerase sigma factor RpoD/SigA [Mucilaginibacter sp. Mucisp84]|uniref:sigma-70 family RNA polymerase sigma factor n=1 Tax=Mucilaginibacter sp. Mucisp84 TaxID=3243058 RepID=UPI0039A6158F